MFPAIFPILDTPSIQAYVGSNPARIFDFGVAPEETPPPYIIHSWVVDQPYEQLSGPPTADLMMVQIDCYCSTMNEARGLARVMRQRLDEVGLSNRLIIQTYEHDTKLYRVGFEVDLIEVF